MLEPYRDRFELAVETFAEGRKRYDPNGWADPDRDELARHAHRP
jgi:hypothetical protein